MTVKAVQRAAKSLDIQFEIDSPNFVPAQLVAFAARGYVRRNRWATR